MKASASPPQKRQKREPSPWSQTNVIADSSYPVVDPENTRSDPDTYGWIACSENVEFERLAIKEKAVEQAQQFCAKLSAMLRPAIDGIQSGSDDAIIMGQELIKQWLSEHDKVLAQNRDYEVLVGIEGPTGAGKSSFLGSLLRIEELLPSGQEGAATAVIGKVSWNYDDTPGHEYRAEITFRKKDEVERELSLLLREMNHRNEIEDFEYEDEDQRMKDMAEASEMINYELPKFQAVWGLEECLLEDFAESCDTIEGEQAAVKEILESNPAALKLMNQGTRHLFSSEPQDLSYEIKPFLDSTARDYGGGCVFSAWPLVQMVNIFVKADILKTGISLVDLPGCGDAVESRAEVARKFKEKLNVRMVASSILRATDEKEGVALMTSGYEEVQMKLDGKLNSRGFCVILTKIDDIAVENYIRGSELREDENIIKKLEHLKSMRKEQNKLRSTYTALQTEKRKAERNSSKAITKYDRQVERAAKYSKGDLPWAVLNKKKELKQNKDRCKVAVEEAAYALEDFDNKKRDLHIRIDQLDTWLHHQAIQTRNAKVQRRIHQIFTRRHSKHIGSIMDGAEDQSLLSVLPVSTKAFWQIKNLASPMPGFQTQRCTGIPAAEQWLHYATLESREKHLDAVLANFHKLMENIWSYSKEQCKGKGSGFTKQEVESALGDTHESFEHEFKSFFAEWSRKIQKIEPLPNRSKEISSFFKKARTKSGRWSYKDPQNAASLQKIPWITYQAILMRKGGRFVSRGATPVAYNWKEDLATILLTQIAEKWDKALNKELPGLKKPIMKDFSKIWKDYLSSIVFAIRQRAPSLEEDFVKLLPSLHSLERTVTSSIESALDDLSDDASHAHNEILEDLERQLAPTFNEALEIRMHQQRQDHIKRKIKTDSKNMCIDIMDALSERLDDRKKLIPEELDDIATKVINDVRALVACLINNLLENDFEGTWIQSRKEVLHQEIREVVLELESQWRFHSQNSGHILLQDRSIPEDLGEFLIKQEEQQRQMYDWNEELADFSE
ncbi:hypothetical protein G7Z17_g10738 [Cylindrodendrum hubeiense]|uniref:Dynamin N-terminal domain-containing protein n=1 Tax=Cylindrodendrum hubeiense TaxID=595255 RepID=A0A9P5GYX7_9HYPO|nr:hypothetical protein G7Z17_g10738 [Cylindrodendrum hubeiense]